MEYTLFLTNKCNMRCTYCYEGLKKNNESMSTTTLENSLDYIFKNEDKSFAIGFLGGEPLIEKNLLFHAIDYINENYPSKKVNYHITTNCTLLDDETISFLNKNNFSVNVSIDGDLKTQELNRKSLTNESYYENILQNIVKLKNSGANLSIRMTVTSNNCCYLYNNIKYFYDLGFNKLHVGINYLNEYSKEYIETLKSQLKLVEDYYLKISRTGGNLVLDIVDGKLLQLLFQFKSGFGMCSAGLKHFIISTSGDFYPCSFVSNEPDFKLGNILTTANSRKSIQIIKDNFLENNLKCEDCSISSFCHGMKCAYLNYKSTGYFNSPNQIMCELEKYLYDMDTRILKELFKINIDKVNIYLNYGIKCKFKKSKLLDDFLKNEKQHCNIV